MPAAATLPAATLEPWTRGMLEAAGLEPAAAATVAATLIETSLRGTDSHGIARVPGYVERIRAGAINPRPRPAIVRRDGAVAVVDGDRGPGQVAATFATDLSVELAREHGSGVVMVRRSTHFGAAAPYARRAARAGMVGIAMTNSEPVMIPFGGAQPALGTNPIALAARAAGGIFDLDLATSQVAINRIFGARDEGRAIPLGWGVDEAGEPTTDPAAVRAAAPLGGYKGYALALLVEILCGVLPAASARPVPGDVGHFLLALDPERTVGRERFAAALAALLDDLRAIPPARGFDAVLAPGDPEATARAERERSGVPIEPALWAQLQALSRELGVPLPGTIGSR